MIPAPPRALRLLALAAILCSDSAAVADGRPAAALARTSEAPVIDGVLDDPAWEGAARVDDFTQVEPDQGRAPSERTLVLITSTAEALYVGVRCFDREPGAVIAKDMRRDSFGLGDDRVRFVLDSYGRGTDGYFFSLAAGGAKADGVIEPRSRRIALNWDAIWDGRTAVDAEGWVAEFEIPFRSIAFDPENTSWGFNVERQIRRRQERVRWASPTRAKVISDLEAAGRLDGVADISTGLGLDIQPTGVARWTRGEDGESEFDFEPSLDLFYRVTPSLTATFTYNTDFAEAEVDERRVNLTRFPLFFPEKRAFFLEDASSFNFGGIFRSPLPFHSRTIGLSAEGDRVPINLGGKLTGKAGRWNLGLLGVGLDGLGELDSDRAYVARVSYDLLDESRVGFIYTRGDPRRNLEAETVGLDFHYKNSKLDGGRTVEWRGWAMGVSNEGEGDGFGYGLRFLYPNRPLNASLSIQRVGEDLRPAMGFVRRPGIHEIINEASYSWYPKDSIISKIDLEAEMELDTDLDFEALSEEYDAPVVEVDFDSGDEVTAGLQYNRERFLEDFEIFDGVVVPTGDYQYWRWFAELETSTKRALSAELEGAFGEYLDGTRTSVETELSWRASPLWELSAGGAVNWIDIGGGEFETVVASAGLRCTPSPRLDFSTVVQYDTVSDEVGLNARLRWIVEPGNDIYLVFNQGYRFDDDRSFERLESEAVAKLGWTFRF